MERRALRPDVTEITPTPSVPKMDHAQTWQGSYKDWRQVWWTFDRWNSDPCAHESTTMAAGSRDNPRDKEDSRRPPPPPPVTTAAPPPFYIQGPPADGSAVPTTPMTPARAPPDLHNDPAAVLSPASSYDLAEDASRFLPIRCSTASRTQEIPGSLRSDDTDYNDTSTGISTRSNIHLAQGGPSSTLLHRASYPCEPPGARPARPCESSANRSALGLVVELGSRARRLHGKGGQPHM